MSIATVQSEVVHDAMLSELAETANREHSLALASAQAAIKHAIAAGEALLTIKAMLPRGEWQPWVEKHWHATQGHACAWMRLAHYKDEVLGRELGIKDGLAHLRMQPATTGRSFRLSDAIRDDAQHLRDQGLSYPAIGRRLGVHHGTVYRSLNPQRARMYAEKQRQLNSTAREERQRKERDRAIRRMGGSVAEGYSLIRRALQALDRAHSETEDKDVRRGINAAMAKMHTAEDEIVRALGVA